MSPDFEAIARRAKKQFDAPWDDLRAARTQKAVLEALRDGAPLEAEHEDSGVTPPPAMREIVGAPNYLNALYAVVFATMAAATVLFWFRPNTTQHVATTQASWGNAELNYEDGSRSILGKEARVQVLEQSDSAVRVEQHSGRVRYDITPKRHRRFTVQTRGVNITVLGTVFDVNLAPNLVTVTVEQGKVQVDHDGARTVLTQGRRLAISVTDKPMTVADMQATRSDAATRTEPSSESAPPRTATRKPTNDRRSVTALPQRRAQHAADKPVTRNSTSNVATSGKTTARRQTPPDAKAKAKRETTASADELLRRADQARARGDHAAATASLMQLLRNHPRDRRSTLARFNLAQVQRAQGRHAQAAQLFEQCGHALKGDAIAEAASSWQMAGRSDRAHAAAKRYLDVFGGGVHAARMRRLSGLK